MDNKIKVQAEAIIDVYVDERKIVADYLRSQLNKRIEWPQTHYGDTKRLIRNDDGELIVEVESEYRSSISTKNHELIVKEGYTLDEIESIMKLFRILNKSN